MKTEIDNVRDYILSEIYEEIERTTKKLNDFILMEEK